MKRKLAAAVAIVLLLGVGFAGYVWYRHLTRENPYESPAPDAPEAPEWIPSPITPEAWSPESASLMPLDLATEFPEVPPEIMGPAPPIEDEPE